MKSLAHVVMNLMINQYYEYPTPNYGRLILFQININLFNIHTNC